MSRRPRRALAVALITGLAGLTLVAVPAAQAKTVAFDYSIAKTGKVPTDLSHLSGKLVGKPFGNGSFTGKTIVPVTTYVWKFKGGTISARFDAKLDGIIASGPLKITGGTGTFAGAKGSGTARGAIDGSVPFHFKGKVSY